MEATGLMERMREQDPLNAEWVTMLLLVVLVALAYTNRSSPRKWRLIAQAMFRMRIGRQTQREEMDLQDRTFIGLILVALVIIALFAWQAFVLAGRDTAPEYFWLVVALGGVLLAHGLVVRTCAVLADSGKGVVEHFYNGLQLFILTGVALLPVVVLIAYRVAWRDTLLGLGGAVVVGLLLYRWARGVWIGVGDGVPLRYIILYLCAAELMPVLLAIRALR